MIEKYFNSQRDKAFIDAGGFFYVACLIGKPLDDQSPDPGYCVGCYEFLVEEAKMTSQKESWIPIESPSWHPQTTQVRRQGDQTVAPERFSAPTASIALVNLMKIVTNVFPPSEA